MIAIAGCSSTDSASTDSAEPLDVFALYRGDGADDLVDVLAEFTESTGVEVQYAGSNDFTNELLARVIDTDDPPDVAIVPQPGLVREFVDNGSLVALDAATVDELQANYDADVVASVRFDGDDHAVPFRRTMKSIVWYRPDLFDANGWEIPATLDELETLSAAIAAADDGVVPWCFGMLAGDVTGWAASDWVEDLVIRRNGREVYDAWTDGDIGFADGRIENAFEEFRSLVLEPDRLVGGVTGAVSTPVDRAWEPLLADEPECAMYHQADFALEWMPDVSVGPDGDLDWFVLPGADESGPPLLIGGDSAIGFGDRPETMQLLQFLAGADSGTSWVERGGFISAKASIDEELYADVDRQFVDALDAAEVQVFDASDQMPPEIGSGLLLEKITDWVTGAIEYDELAEAVDSARADADGG